MARIQLLMEERPKYAATEKNTNETKNEEILFMEFIVRLIELLFLIFFTSYIFCVAWIIICKTVEDFWFDIDYANI